MWVAANMHAAAAATSKVRSQTTFFLSICFFLTDDVLGLPNGVRPCFSIVLEATNEARSRSLKGPSASLKALKPNCKIIFTFAKANREG